MADERPPIVRLTWGVLGLFMLGELAVGALVVAIVLFLINVVTGRRTLAP